MVLRACFYYTFTMHPNNEKIAALLREIADILDFQAIAFKPAAYRRAAQTIEDQADDICLLATVKELQKLPGIGEAIASKIREYCDNGSIKFLDALRSEIGLGSLSLLQVDDLGPKRVVQLQKELGIKTVEDLIKAAQEGKLRSLPRFSQHLEAKILENAKSVGERSKRFVRSDIESEVESLLESIRGVEGIKRAQAAGSYRRHKETVGDIDIVATLSMKTGSAEKKAAFRKNVEEKISTLPAVRKIVAFGNTKLSFDAQSGLRVDVRFVEDDEWGSALLYFTGDKEHNIALRKIAIAKGWKLNEYGLFDGEKNIASKTEEEIYEKLGLRYVEPRERRGEIL